MIRKWHYEDLLAVSKLEKECFSAPWSYKMLAESFLSKGFSGFLFELGGEIIGYGGYISPCGEADITKIAVNQKFRKKGIGRQLLKAMIDDCRKKDIYQITLEVRVSNVSAIALYSSCGFKNIARRQNYYGDEDAFVMQYLLKE